MSPTLFSVYLDDLLGELRALGMGCHMGGAWVGAAGYADDLILLAPSRTAMQKMLLVCEQYAADHNLQFSTDPEPSKSKSKCLYMCGQLEADYPKPVKLCGQDLPWVKHATHLGHELHQVCNMEFDANMKRGEFIENSVQIRETFHFANPEEVLSAVQVYASHWYGAMLWDLYGDKVGQLCRAWSTCVKLAWDLPRSTHTFLVEGLLARNFFTVKQQLVGRFVNFFRELQKSKSLEVRIVSSMVGRCVRSTTGKNLALIERDTGLDPWVTPAWKVRAATPREEIPVSEGWRAQYLTKLIQARRSMQTNLEDSSDVENLIESLCSS